MSEAERAGRLADLRPRIRQETRNREKPRSCRAGTQTVDSEREAERRYGEQLEATKERLAKAQKRQALDRCLMDAESQAQQVWNNACAKLSRPADCLLPRTFVYQWKAEVLNAKQECVNYYGE